MEPWPAQAVWECDDPDELTGAVVRREVELRDKARVEPRRSGALASENYVSCRRRCRGPDTAWAEHTDVRDAAEDSDGSDQPAKVE